MNHLLLIGGARSHAFAVWTKNQHIGLIFFHKIINRFFIITTQDLFKIILAHIAVSFQILNGKVDLVSCIFYLFGSTTQFYLCATAEYLEAGKFLFKNIQFAVVNT